jgi:L-iditol 2-dehydrogenase
MQAVVYHGRADLRVEELSVPRPEPGEMLVRVEACGICPTDLKKIEKGLLSGPRVFGHEIAGRVEALGEGVEAYAPGDRVVVHHHVPCGSCFYCGRGAYAQCPFYKRNGTTAGFEPSGGGYSQFVLARDWIVRRGTIRIPDGIAAEEAAFVEPVNTCLKAARKARIEPGETVLVVGLGPIGLLLVQIARALGATTAASDPLEERRRLAQALGTGLLLDPAADVAAALHACTEGRGADCVLIAAPGQAAFEQAVRAARPGGRLLSFAATAPGETVNVDLGTLTSLEKDLLTAYSSSIELQEEAAELVFSRRVRTAELVSHRFPVARALEAFELASGRAPGTLKVVLSSSAA